MTFTPTRLACLALLSLAAASPCLAESFASSASSAGSVAVAGSSAFIDEAERRLKRSMSWRVPCALAEVDLARRDAVRAQLPALAHRRL